MKTGFLKYALIALCLILLLCFVFLFIRPVYNRTVERIENFSSYMLDNIGEKAGISIGYSSLSPSIFSHIYIKDVTVANRMNGHKLVQLKEVRVKYNIFDVLKGNYDKALKEISFKGGEISYSQAADGELLEKLILLLKNGDGLAQKDDKKFLFSFRLSLEDIRFTYSDSNLIAEMLIKNAGFQSDFRRSSNNFTLASSVKITPLAGGKLSAVQKRVEGLNFDLNANGTYESDLSKVSGQINLNNIKAGDYNLAKLAFIGNFDGKNASLRMVQNLLPFNIKADWNVENGKFLAQLDADSLDLSSLFNSSLFTSDVKKLKGSSFSGTYTLSANSKTGGISYSADGSLSFTKTMMNGGFLSEYKVSGTNKSIDIKNLLVKTGLFETTAQVSCDFETLKTGGFVDIRRVNLPNGKQISAPIYIDPLDRGAVFSIPKITSGGEVVDGGVVSFVKNGKIVDIAFALPDDGIKLSGICNLNGKPHLTADMNLDSVKVSDIAKKISVFLNEEQKKKILNSNLEPYQFSAEAKFSTDFSSVSFDAPLVSVINTSRDDQYITFSASGEENLITISNLDTEWAGQKISGTVQADIGKKFEDIIFSTNLKINDIPYSLAGTFIPEESLSLTGDYGLEVFLDLMDKSPFGNLSFSDFPVRIGKVVLGVSADAAFSFLFDPLWRIQISRLEVKELTNYISARPRLLLKGGADRFGVVIDTISYADSVGELTGRLTANWEQYEEMVDGLTASLELDNLLSEESIRVSLSGYNPDKKTYAEASFKQDYYFMLESEINNFHFSHILSKQNASDRINAVLNASGTIEDPFCSLTIAESMCSVAGYPLEVNGKLLFEDRMLSSDELEVSYRDQIVKNVVMSFWPQDFRGVLSADFLGQLFVDSEAAHSFRIPLILSLDSEQAQTSGRKKFLPEDFSVTAEIAGVSGDLINIPDAYTYTLKKTQNRFDLTGGKQNELQAYFIDNERFSLSLAEPSPLTCSVNGIINIKQNAIDLFLRDVTADLSRMRGILTYPVFEVHDGVAVGSGTISGKLTDPDFDGLFTVSGMDVAVPKYVTEVIHAPRIPLVIEQSTFRIEPLVLQTKKGMVLFDAFAYFERWRLDVLSMNIRTLDGKIGARYDLPFLDVTGDVACQLLIELTLHDIDISGNISVENGSGELALGKSKKDSNRSFFDSKVDLDIEIGEQTEVVYPSRKNPLLWGQITPKTKMSVKVDTILDTFEFKGDLSLRGGEILYIGRNFYIREGRMIFDANQDIVDPIVTLKAEIRERDENRNLVKIILSAENQFLSQLSPTLSSSPAKTEKELMELLGQVIFADTVNSDTALQEMAAGLMDYGAQVTVLEQVEKRLRKFLKFDIFSMRTLVLQNTMLEVLNASKTGSRFDMRSLLNNTSMYVGKYFGDSLYADAMLQLVYDETKLNRNNSLGGLRVQPEIGFEMASPFVNVRWSLAPDTANFKNLWVPDTSVTLSWKFQL